VGVKTLLQSSPSPISPNAFDPHPQSVPSSAHPIVWNWCPGAIEINFTGRGTVMKVSLKSESPVPSEEQIKR
jgi:hypothetical protein